MIVHEVFTPGPRGGEQLPPYARTVLSFCGGGNGTVRRSARRGCFGLGGCRGPLCRLPHPRLAEVTAEQQAGRGREPAYGE
jgi:hypothetical protein